VKAIQVRRAVINGGIMLQAIVRNVMCHLVVSACLFVLVSLLTFVNSGRVRSAHSFE